MMSNQFKRVSEFKREQTFRIDAGIKYSRSFFRETVPKGGFFKITRIVLENLNGWYDVIAVFDGMKKVFADINRHREPYYDKYVFMENLNIIIYNEMNVIVSSLVSGEIRVTIWVEVTDFPQIPTPAEQSNENRFDNSRLAAVLNDLTTNKEDKETDI